MCQFHQVGSRERNVVNENENNVESEKGCCSGWCVAVFQRFDGGLDLGWGTENWCGG